MRVWVLWTRVWRRFKVQWEQAEAGSRVKIGKVNRTPESYGTKHWDSKWIVAGLTKQESGSRSTASKQAEWINQCNVPKTVTGKFVFWRISPPQESVLREPRYLCRFGKSLQKKSLCNCVHARISRLWTTWNFLNHCHCSTCNPNLLCFGVGIKKQLSGLSPRNCVSSNSHTRPSLKDVY